MASTLSHETQTTLTGFKLRLEAVSKMIKEAYPDGAAIDLANSSEQQYTQLREFVFTIPAEVANIGDKSLNPNLPDLFLHIDIMTGILQTAYDASTDLRSLCQRIGVNRNGLGIISVLHDYSRFIGNGSLPFDYIDVVSHQLLSEDWPGIVTKGVSEGNQTTQHINDFLHEQHWLYSDDQCDYLQASNDPLDIFRLILKAVDSISKLSVYRDGDNISAAVVPLEDYLKGRYQNWILQSRASGKFPLQGANGLIVELDDYVSRDELLMRQGYSYFTSLLTGDKGIDHILSELNQRINFIPEANYYLTVVQSD